MTIFSTDQTINFSIWANHSANNQILSHFIITSDDTLPNITLDMPLNNSITKKPQFINISIDELNIHTALWRANVSQITWTSNFIGSFDINISNFNSNQPVKFWIYVNDSAGNECNMDFWYLFDDSLPTLEIIYPYNNAWWLR